MNSLLAPATRPARALQQPEWRDPAQVELVRELLRSYAPLARLEDVDALRSQLVRAAQGDLHVLQAGDCAEDPSDCTAWHIRRKAEQFDTLARLLECAAGTPALRVGRIAGQFAKPRSAQVEVVGGRTLPVFRGHLVNSPDPDPRSREPDPLRLLTGYMAASEIMMRVGWRVPGVTRAPRATDTTVWTSHEALVLDYEQPMIREHAGRRWLGSTHWPWIGERTRQPDGPHVALLSQVANPVGCKVGPGIGAGELVELCDRLDRDREPGRLTLIARMGADTVAHRLPPLVEAVRAAGHPVLWLCDPLHGNTVVVRGRKTRFVSAVVAEVRAFRRAVDLAGGVAGGLHLETTPDDVTECVADAAARPARVDHYTSLCDPRLNPGQAAEVVTAWSALDRTRPYRGEPSASRVSG